MISRLCVAADMCHDSCRTCMASLTAVLRLTWLRCHSTSDLLVCAFAGKPAFMSCVFICVQADDSACLDVSLAYCDLAFGSSPGQRPCDSPMCPCRMLVQLCGHV